MTVTYELPRLTGVGSLRALTLSIADRPPDADVGGIPDVPGSPVSATS